jgi:hypothetical protein
MAAIQYSYRQYPGNGSTTSFAVPFPYLLKAHVRVYLGFNLLDGTYTVELAETTGYTWTSGTAIQTVAAPASGQTLTVIRQTPNSQQLVQWQDGSTLISEDLNTSDKQNLYVIQEQQDRNDAGIAQSTSAKAAVDAVIAAVANSVTYVAVANVAAIPSSPADNTFIELANSTGLESFSPLAGRPSGFVGDSGLTVRLRYGASPATWSWISYYANNSDTRYLKLAGGTLTGPLTLPGAPSSSLQATTRAYVDAADTTLTAAAAAAQTTANTAVTNAAAAQSTASAALPQTGGTLTGPLTGTTASFSGAVSASSATFSSLVTATSVKDSSSGFLTVPPGSIFCFATPNAPAGYLKANGAAVSRTTYDTLFSAIGTAFGVGDGSTTFNLPDLRGEFIRGWDDSRNVDSGRGFGTSQAHAFASHNHLAITTYQDDYQNPNIPSQPPPGFGRDGTGQTDWYTSNTGGSETRPRNIALLYCIKY